MDSFLRFEDKLDGVVKFSPWKERIAILLEEQELWYILHHIAIAHVVIPTDPTKLDAYNKNNVKAESLISDAVKYHLILHISGKKNAYEMWVSLIKLYQCSNEN